MSHIEERPKNAVKTNFGWVDKDTSELLVSVLGGFPDNEFVIGKPNGGITVEESVEKFKHLLIEVPHTPAVLVPDAMQPIGIDVERPHLTIQPDVAFVVEPILPTPVYLNIKTHKDVKTRTDAIALPFEATDGTSVKVEPNFFTGEIVEGQLKLRLGTFSKEYNEVQGVHTITVTVRGQEPINYLLQVSIEAPEPEVAPQEPPAVEPEPTGEEPVVGEQPMEVFEVDIEEEYR